MLRFGYEPAKIYRIAVNAFEGQYDKEVILKRVDDTHVMVYCKNPIKSITSGQAAVFYLGEECLGGGTICKVYRNGKLLKC